MQFSEAGGGGQRVLRLVHYSFIHSVAALAPAWACPRVFLYHTIVICKIRVCNNKKTCGL